jgi:hypothetical protein
MQRPDTVAFTFQFPNVAAIIGLFMRTLHMLRIRTIARGFCAAVPTKPALATASLSLEHAMV